ncbi:hypothetical protein HMPREF9371_1871 [Neisseria shayeganii 871]|uniref:Uncharacterized protein n=1 Tax=Neisseria shayeganii 871 TaxID=1032488 RepID=G4CJT1_9NEIS|nr:hypothetical protein HMPREF9371_1871 [Neisseria shayeganii 871]
MSAKYSILVQVFVCRRHTSAALFSRCASHIAALATSLKVDALLKQKN